MDMDEEIRERFGEGVEQIVLGCTDADRRLNEDFPRLTLRPGSA
jgi:hypothetical protein